MPTEPSEGTAEEDWLESERWSEVPALILDRLERLVVVAGDLASGLLGTAGLISRATSLGVPVEVVVIGSPEGMRSQTCGRALDGTRGAALIDWRFADGVDATGARSERQEVARGVRVQYLRVARGQVQERSEVLARRLRSLDPGTGTLLVGPWRRDGDSDLDTAGAVTAWVARSTGAQLLEYPIRLWHDVTPCDRLVPWTRFATLALTAAESGAKSAALEAVTDRAREDYFERPFESFITPVGSPTLPAPTGDDGAHDPGTARAEWTDIRKRALTLASLPRPLFAAGLEIGCSIGALTAELSGRCAQLRATDITEVPVDPQTVRRFEAAGVELVRYDNPADWPRNEFDLIVLSEVAYYWTPAELERAVRFIDGALAADGVLVAAHGRLPVDGFGGTGDVVHQALRDCPRLEVLSQHLEEDFRLEVFTRPGPLSVAAGTVKL